MRMIAAGLVFALVVSGCSKAANPVPAAAAASGATGGASGGAKPAHPGGPNGPKPPADPMAGAIVYECDDGGELHVVFDAAAGTARVRPDADEAVSLPREQKADLEAYSDGGRTLGVSPSGVLAYTETPAPPRVCRLAAKADVKDRSGAKDRAAAAQAPSPPGASAAKDKPAPKDPEASKAQTPSKDQVASKDLIAPKAVGVTRNFTAADQGKTIEMKVGEKISISLVAIPTAGYVWVADASPSFVKVSDGPSGPTISAQTQPGYTGGSHWEVLVIEAVKSGDGDLLLAMRRPWQKPPDLNAESFSVKLRVN